MAALQNFCVFTKLLLGPCEEVNRVITGRLVQREKHIGRVLRGKASLECSCLVFDLLPYLRAESTGFFITQFGLVVESIQTSTGSVVSPIQSGLGFRIDDADGNWIVMSSQAVDSKAKQCEVTVVPSEGTIKMPLHFEFTIVRARQVGE